MPDYESDEDALSTPCTSSDDEESDHETREPPMKKAKTPPPSEKPAEKKRGPSKPTRLFLRTEAQLSTAVLPKEIVLLPPQPGGARAKSEGGETVKRVPVKITNVKRIGMIFRVPAGSEKKPSMTVADIKAMKIELHDLAYGVDDAGVEHYWVHTMVKDMSEPQTEISPAHLKDMMKKVKGKAGVPDKSLVPPPAAAGGPNMGVDITQQVLNNPGPHGNVVHIAYDKSWKAKGLTAKGDTYSAKPAGVVRTAQEMLAELPVAEARRIAREFLESTAEPHIKNAIKMCKANPPKSSALKPAVWNRIDKVGEAGKGPDDVVSAIMDALNKKHPEGVVKKFTMEEELKNTIGTMWETWEAFTK